MMMIINETNAMCTRSSLQSFILIFLVVFAKLSLLTSAQSHCDGTRELYGNVSFTLPEEGVT